MAFNIDHTANGDITLVGAHCAFTGDFLVPIPQNNSDTQYILVEGVSIDAISGLQSELDLKELACNLRSAKGFDSGNACNQIPVIGAGNVLVDSIFPKAAITTMFTPNSTGGLVFLNQAGKGDLATVVNQNCTYVLCSDSFNNINHWRPLVQPTDCLFTVNNLTGAVCLDGHNISGVSSVLNTGIQSLYTGKIENSCLTDNYWLTNGVSGFEAYLTSYATTGCVASDLSFYPTTGQVTNTLSYYQKNTGFGGVSGALTGYVPHSETGTSAYLRYTGTAYEDIVVVEDDGYVSSSLFPQIGFSDFYTISTSGDLITLTNASIGDVAVDHVNHKNYILVSSGLQAYQDINNWKQFQNKAGTVVTVNGVFADAETNIQIDTSDILYGDSGSIVHTDAQIQHLHEEYEFLTGTYQTCSSLTGDICTNYTTIASFDDILNTKSTTGHKHEIADVTGLSSCLTYISPFQEGDLVDLCDSESYKLNPNSTNTSFTSLMLGSNSKASVFGEIAIAAGAFVENGDAQSSELVLSVQTSDDSWTTLVTPVETSIPVESNSLSLVNASIIGRGVTDTSLYAAFTVQALVSKEQGSASVEKLEENIYSRTVTGYSARVIAGASDIQVQVKGDTDNMYWVAQTNLIKVKGGTMATDGTGVYFSGGVNNSWYTLSNWYVDGALSVSASVLPVVSSNVEMYTAAYVNLDCGSWVQPNSIDTTAVADDKGICFYSNASAIFSGTVYGNASFFGSATFQ